MYRLKTIFYAKVKYIKCYLDIIFIYIYLFSYISLSNSARWFKCTDSLLLNETNIVNIANNNIRHFRKSLLDILHNLLMTVNINVNIDKEFLKGVVIITITPTLCT